MSKIKKYGIILTTVFTVFASSLIVTQATNCTITTGSSLYNVELTHWQTINFADYCTGTISLNYNGKTGWNYLILGASVTSSGSTITLAVDDCKQIMIIYYRNSTSAGIDPPSVTIKSNSTTSVTHVNQSYLESKFQTIDGYLSDIDSAVSTIKLYLADILLDNDNIQSQLTTLGNYLSTTNTSLELIRQTIALTNQSLLSVISGLNEINDNNYNIPYESLMAYAFFREMATGGIKTLEGYYAPYYPISSLTKGHVLLRTGYTYYLSYMVNRTNSGYISSIQNESGTTNANYSVVDGLPLINGIRVITYQITVTTQDYYNFTFDSSLSGVYVIPLYYGNGEHISEEMKSITGINTLSDEAERLQAIYTWLSNFTQIDYTDQLDDIYTWLTNYSQIDYTNQLNEVIEAINGLQPDQNTTTNITNFNTDMETITDIENDFSVDFGNYDTTFRNNNTEKWTFDTNKQLPVNKLHEVFSQVINIIPVGTTWMSIVLLGAVLIAILG